MNNRLYHHVVEQPFIFATGIAALVHSTWSIGTLFSGKQPDAALNIQFIGWIVPAFLIAFALDVGQIATSAEIRAGNRTKAKYATFAIFALSTFYLQWLYIAHHMPALELAGGVRGEWNGFATLLRDASIWIIPMFLPLSTLMYTFSADHEQPVAVQTESQNVIVTPVQVETPVHHLPELPAVEREQLPAGEPENAVLQSLKPSEEIPTEYIAECPSCGMKKTYDNPESMRRGLSTHLARYCPSLHLEQSPVLATNGNGHHHEE